MDVWFRGEGIPLLNLGWRKQDKGRKVSQTPQNVFFCFAFFQWDHWGGSEFFFLSFLGRKIAKLWVGWIKDSLGGGRQDSSFWERRKQKEERWEERKKDIPQGIFKINRERYKSEHKSLKPKKTVCATVRGRGEMCFFGKERRELWRLEGGVESHRPLRWNRKGGVQKGEGL